MWFNGFDCLCFFNDVKAIVNPQLRKLNLPFPLSLRWRRSRSAVWTYLPEIINSASSTTPMEKCVATTPGRLFSWSMKARMLRETGTPSAARPVPSFPMQSPVHSVTNYPHVCLRRSFHPAGLTVGNEAKVCVNFSPYKTEVRAGT